MVRVRPSAAGSPLNALIQRPWLITTTGASGMSSASVNTRPRCGATPSVVNSPADTRPPTSVRGSASPVSANDVGRYAPTLASCRFRRHLTSSGAEATKESGVAPPAPLSTVMLISRAGSSYGSGWSTSVLTTLKITVVAPMPRASVKTAAAV